MVVPLSIQAEPGSAWNGCLPGDAPRDPPGDTVHFSVKPPALHPQAHLAGHPLQSVGHTIPLQSCRITTRSECRSSGESERYKGKLREAERKQQKSSLRGANATKRSQAP